MRSGNIAHERQRKECARKACAAYHVIHFFSSWSASPSSMPKDASLETVLAAAHAAQVASSMATAPAVATLAVVESRSSISRVPELLRAGCCPRRGRVRWCFRRAGWSFGGVRRVQNSCSARRSRRRARPIQRLSSPRRPSSFPNDARSVRHAGVRRIAARVRGSRPRPDATASRQQSSARGGREPLITQITGHS